MLCICHLAITVFPVAIDLLDGGQGLYVTVIVGTIVIAEPFYQGYIPAKEQFFPSTSQRHELAGEFGPLEYLHREARQ